MYGSIQRKKTERLKSVYIRAKKKVNEHFGRKMHEDVNRNRKLFWKVSNEKEGNVESCKGNEKMAQRKDEVQRCY